MINFYEVLEVHKDSSPEEIKLAYRKKISEVHPDRGVKSEVQRQENAALINEAYSFLKNSEKRRQLDHWLQLREARPPSIPNDYAKNTKTKIENEVDLISEFKRNPGLSLLLIAIVVTLVYSFFGKRTQQQRKVSAKIQSMHLQNEYLGWIDLSNRIKIPPNSENWDQLFEQSNTIHLLYTYRLLHKIEFSKCIGRKEKKKLYQQISSLHKLKRPDEITTKISDFTKKHKRLLNCKP